MMEIELKRDEFEEWLKKQDDDKIFSCSCLTCPLAIFLQEKYNRVDISVEWNSIYQINNCIQQALPYFARKFIWYWGDTKSNAKDALKILKEIE